MMQFDDWVNEVCDRIYQEQEQEITERFGAAIAKTANYGWAINEGHDCVTVHTKVYPNKRDKCWRSVLISRATHPSLDNIDHDWED